MPNTFYTYKQFYFKQLSLAKVRSLNVKTVHYQTIQFSISTQFSGQKHLYIKQSSLFKQFCFS